MVLIFKELQIILLFHTEGRSILLIICRRNSRLAYQQVQAQASDISEAPVFTAATGGTITTCWRLQNSYIHRPWNFYSYTKLGNAPTVPTGGPKYY